MTRTHKLVHQGFYQAGLFSHRGRDEDSNSDYSVNYPPTDSLAGTPPGHLAASGGVVTNDGDRQYYGGGGAEERGTTSTVGRFEDQGWKFMGCSHCQELCQQASWLLIGCTKVNDQSEAMGQQFDPTLDHDSNL